MNLGCRLKLLTFNTFLLLDLNFISTKNRETIDKSNHEFWKGDTYIPAALYINANICCFKTFEFAISQQEVWLDSTRMSHIYRKNRLHLVLKYPARVCSEYHSNMYKTVLLWLFYSVTGFTWQHRHTRHWTIIVVANSVAAFCKQHFSPESMTTLLAHVARLQCVKLISLM